MNATLTIPLTALFAFVTVSVCVQWDSAPVDDGIAYYVVSHEGPGGAFTNTVSGTQTCLSLPLGQHSFRVMAVTTNGLASEPSFITTTFALEVTAK